jgi:hypothetical protein
MNIFLIVWKMYSINLLEMAFTVIEGWGELCPWKVNPDRNMNHDTDQLSKRYFSCLTNHLQFFQWYDSIWNDLSVTGTCFINCLIYGSFINELIDFL